MQEDITVGNNPKIEKEKQKDAATNTFGAIESDWYQVKSHAWSENYCKKVRSLMESYALPPLRERDISSIDVPEVLALLKVIEAQDKLETMAKVRGFIGQVFNHGIATGKCKNNPIAAIKGAFKTKKSEPYAHLKTPEEVGKFLQKVEAYNGSFSICCALKLMPLLFLRPTELAKGEWTEVDFETCLWKISAERMKSDRPHIIPLSTQVLAILKDLHRYSGGGKYLFPNISSPDETINIDSLRLAMRRMGYSKEQVTPHGFRHTASTLLHEMASEHGWHSEMIELQLSHSDKNKIRATYNHAKYLKERKLMMQFWADHLYQYKEKCL